MTLTQFATNIHRHRYVRRLIFLALLVHVFLVNLPTAPVQVRLPFEEITTTIRNFLWNVWPLPTIMLSDENSPVISNIALKGLEICVQLLYILDLLPKCIFWKKPLWWKLLNAVVVTSMAAAVSLTSVSFLDVGAPREFLRVRVTSICLSILIFCEVTSLAAQEPEEEVLKPPKRQTAQNIWTDDGSKTELPEFEWEEIVKHDKPEDCWVVIHGHVYDLTSWVPLHPGGDVIYDGAGGDCTSMFESYHPLYVTDKGAPKRFLIGRVKDYKDFYSWEGTFYRELKQEVEAVISPAMRRDDSRLIIKALLVCLTFLLSLAWWVWTASYLAAVVFGLCCAQIGVNIMHDGNHGAFSSSKRLCWWAGYMLDLVGSSSLVYRRSHDFGHHACVNHFELDRGYDTTFPWFRLHDRQPLIAAHKWQWLYMPLIYSLTTIADYKGTFAEMTWMSNYPARKAYVSRRDYVLQVLTKLLWKCYALFLPLYWHGSSVWGPFLVYLISYSHGYAWFFAVNHWTEEAETSENSNTDSTNWAVLQVRNSTNFAMGSKVWTWLSGGLNYQIEHHLFPGICHTRYPEIAPIVQRVCAKHGVRYFSFPDMWSAVKSHMNLLYKMGRPVAVADDKKAQ